MLVSRRTPIAAIATVVVALAFTAPVAADRPVRERSAPWRITYATVLRQLPGEASPRIATLAVGTRVQVLGQKSRWLRAKYQGKLGWIPRSTAEPPTTEVDEPAPRPTERWRGRGEITVAGRIKPVVRDARADVATPESEPDQRPVEIRAAQDVDNRRRLRLRAGVGATTLGVDFQSDGQTELAGYEISASAVAAAVAGELTLPLGPLSLGVDAAYSVAIGAPGIRYQMPGDTSEPVDFSIQDVDTGLRIGGRLPLGGGVCVWGRTGWHLTWLHVGEVDNPGLLARERLTGITVGGRLEAAIGTDLVGRAGADLLVGGDRDQTPGLEDGETASASAAWLTLSLGYLVTRTLALEGGYRFGRMRTRWSGASQRQPDVMSAERTDHTHGFAISINKAFE